MSNSQGNIEWHQEKIRKYFSDCFGEVYDPFLHMSSELIQALSAFVTDETHTGSEADSSKSFVNQRQIKLVEDTIYCIQKLQSMMQGSGFESEVPLLEDFIADLAEHEDAVIKTQHLDKVAEDFAGYNSVFNEIYPKITHIHREVENIARGCDVISRKSYTWPNPRESHLALDDITTPDKSGGFVPEFSRKFLAFHEEHSNDIEKSAFKSLLDTIVHNLHEIVEGMNKGVLDITNFDGTKDNISWKDPKDILAPEDAEEYLKFFESYKAYLKGMIPRCQVYLYDPVNLNNGNYINDREDLNIAGVYPLSVRRFYNAQSDRSGYFGKGWTSLFDMHLTKEGEDDDSKIKVLFADGHEGSYVRYFTKASTNEKKRKDNGAVSEEDSKKYDLDEVGEIEFVTTKDGRAVVKEDYENEEKEYIEEHGESGRLIEYKDHYRLIQDDGSYTEFRKDGKISAFGNERTELARVEYDGERPLGICDEYRYIRLYFNDEGCICTAKDNTGRAVRYEYEDKNGTNLLTLVTYPDGATRKYRYDENSIIGEVDTPNGTTFLKNEYDDKKRVTKQSFPDGGVITYLYDEENHITTATEQNGLKVEYLSDEFGRHIGTRYPEQGIGESFTYNDKNQKTTATDKRGYTTRFSYDNRGHLTKVIDAKGNITNITYNAAGKPIVVKGPDGATYKYSYNSYGELTNVVNPLNEESRLYYDDNGQVERIRDAEGNYTYLKYDDNKDICYIKDSKGVETFYERDNLGRVISTKNALGAETTYEYDVMDRISKVTDPLGNVTEYTYDISGKLIRVINPDKTVKTWEHNNIGKVSEYTDEAGRSTSIKYNNVWDEEEITLPNGGKVTYEYDLLKRLIKVTDPERRETSYGYDENGNVIAEYNGDIKVKSLTYDPNGNVTSETDALGHVQKYDYDVNGNLIAVTDAAGNRFTREVDALGRIVKETDALGNSTSYTYTKTGDVQSVTDAEGRVRRFDYRKGQLIATYFCDRLEQKLIYDRLGRVEKRTFADGYEIGYSYDALNRVESVAGSDGRKVSYEYDSMGRVVKVTDANTTTLYTYTPTGRLKSVVDALGNETAYTYDALDNLKSIHRAEGLVSDEEKSGDVFPTVGKDGRVTIYSYDLSGQLTEVIDALGRKETYEYDQYGRLKTKTDRDNYATTYEYNNAGVVTKVGYADGRSVAFSYNELNQPNQINDWYGKTILENDILGRLTKVTDFKNRTVAYEYGATGERTKLTYPDGRAVSYKYDDKLQLSSVIGNGEETTYAYDEIGRLVSKNFANGVSQAYTYMPGGNLESMTSSDKQGTLDKYFYSYNNAGLISGIDRNRRGLDKVSGRYEYSYDAIGRLTKTTHDGITKDSYEYDAFGNRTAMSEIAADTSENIKTAYTYDVLDRLIETKELNSSQAILKTYEYDNRGNQTKEFINGILQKSFTFDVTNMLSKVVDKDKGELENFYNGLGFRVASTRPEERIEYLCDLSKDYYNLLERTVNGETESFVYDNNVISMSKSGNNFYYLQDELGSPMYMTGTDGFAVSSYAFDDFGRNIDPFTGEVRNNRNQNASKHAYATNGNIIQPFAFAGYQEDGISGLQFANARYYSADNGRFQSEDNVRGFTDTPFTLNHYGYCWGNPVIYVDLDGNMPYILAGAIVGGLIGGGMEIVSQVTSGEKLDGLSILSATLGGAVSGAIITANPAAAVTSTVAGGIVERSLDGIFHGHSASDIAIDVGVGMVTDVVFANMGKFIAKTPAVKKITEAVNSTAIGTKLNAIVSKSDRYYRSAMTRARNTGTQVHARTILNGLISQGEKSCMIGY
jgi:RHS repeat-associated protein